MHHWQLRDLVLHVGLRLRLLNEAQCREAYRLRHNAPLVLEPMGCKSFVKVHLPFGIEMGGGVMAIPKMIPVRCGPAASPSVSPSAPAGTSAAARESPSALAAGSAAASSQIPCPGISTVHVPMGAPAAPAGRTSRPPLGMLNSRTPSRQHSAN